MKIFKTIFNINRLYTLYQHNKTKEEQKNREIKLKIFWKGQVNYWAKNDCDGLSSISEDKDKNIILNNILKYSNKTINIYQKKSTNNLTNNISFLEEIEETIKKGTLVNIIFPKDNEISNKYLEKLQRLSVNVKLSNTRLLNQYDKSIDFFIGGDNKSIYLQHNEKEAICSFNKPEITQKYNYQFNKAYKYAKSIE